MVPNWSSADFTRVIRTGTDPGGRQISDEMPWKEFNEMFVDEDINAIYQYLHGLQPVCGPEMAH